MSSAPHAPGAGAQVDRIARALAAAFSRDELRRVLQVGLDVNFDAVVPDRPYAVQTFELVQWANRQGRLEELVACAYEQNKGNRELAVVYAEIREKRPDTPEPLPAGAQEPALAQPASSHHLFLAYSRQDAEFMRRLRADLLAVGIRVWVDDQDLEPGTPLWQRAIQRAIRDAQCLLAILSPDACESEWVNSEITLARRRKLRIFPVLARGEEDDAVPLALVSVQYVDARSDYEGAVQRRLLPAVRKHLGLTAGPQAEAPVTVAPSVRQDEDVAQWVSKDAPLPISSPPELNVLLDFERFTPEQRNEAGELLGAERGRDTRVGVGLRGDGLPDIDWVEVPEVDERGRREFIYQGNKRRVEPTFWMARYPVTYEQFQAFVEAKDGYLNARWWEGLDAPEGVRSAPWEQSFRFWNHPRERVSWYEAVAFCRWLTEQAQPQRDLLPPALRQHGGWRISLPTEWQWEKAARGPDGRRYPWGGDDYRSGYANINETYKSEERNPVGMHYLRKTSAVGMYPQGASPYGICDLSGNVWEWCLNELANPQRIQEAGTNNRVLRGGSWSDPFDNAAAVARSWFFPLHSRNFIGFRVVVCAVPVS